MEVEGALELNRILFDHSKDAYDLSCQMVDAVEVRMLVSFIQILAIRHTIEQSSGLSENLASIGKRKSVRIEKKDSIMKTVTEVKDELIETNKMIEYILKEEDRARERREDVRKIKRRARDTASELIETETQKQIAEINKSFQIRKTTLQKKLIS